MFDKLLKVVVSILLINSYAYLVNDNIFAQETTNYGYHKIDYDPDLTKQTFRRSKISLPTSYSSVEQGNVTDVKNQGTYGTCWALAATSSGESSIIIQNGINNNIDLSEKHLAYFFYNR